jgi:hypothetical protein
MGMARAGRVIVAVHTSHNPDGGEWDKWLDLCRVAIEDARKAPNTICAAVFTDGGGPTAPQRGALIEILGDVRFPTAIITTSAIARGIVTAISWFTPGNIRAFAPRDWRNAQRHIALDDTEWQSAVQTAETLAKRFGNLAALKGMQES